jgi:hypothetical protein
MKKLARELFEVTLAARRKVDGYSDGRGWESIGSSNQTAWRVLAIYVLEHFSRKEVSEMARKKKGQAKKQKQQPLKAKKGKKKKAVVEDRW